MALNVVYIKLINGDDILGECTDEGASYFTIKNPVRVIVMPNKNDPSIPSVGFAPWAEFSEEKSVQINKTVVVSVFTPVREFVNQYNSMFGGIVAPTSKLIMPT